MNLFSLNPSIKYELIRLAGEGLNARVYKAYRVDPGTGLRQLIALKILKSKKLVELWRHEFESLAQIRHENCVQPLAFDWFQNQPCLVLEWVEGENLHEVTRQIRLSETEVEAISREVYLGLKAIWGAGLVHGDLGPKNVLLDQDGRIKLIDFGGANQWNRQTTPEFASPQVLDGGPMSVGSDLFSLAQLREFLHNGPSASLDFKKDQVLLKSGLAVQEAQLGFMNPAKRNTSRTPRWPSSRLIGTASLPSKDRRGTRCSPLLGWALVTILSLSLNGAQAGTVLKSLKGCISVRTLRWHQLSINGKELGSSPTTICLYEGHYRLYWSSQKGSGKRSLTVKSGVHIFLKDQDFKVSTSLKEGPRGPATSDHLGNRSGLD